jgi:hypothetical protein
VKETVVVSLVSLCLFLLVSSRNDCPLTPPAQPSLINSHVSFFYEATVNPGPVGGVYLVDVTKTHVLPIMTLHSLLAQSFLTEGKERVGS